MKMKCLDFIVRYLRPISHLYNLLILYGTTFFWGYALRSSFLFSLGYYLFILVLGFFLSEFWFRYYKMAEFQKSYFDKQENETNSSH